MNEDYSVTKWHLKIFLGYASGVGKSFRMLDEARRRRERGQDVVVAAIQPNLPQDAEALLRKLEAIPLKEINRGSAIDVDALLRRRPEVCFVDGLAYGNPPGSRHETRWQDVKELAEAGIKVVASINIQYIGEIREQVEVITGKRVTDTVPLAFINSADEIEIVDAPAIEVRGETLEERAGAEKRQYQLSRLREMALVLAAYVAATLAPGGLWLSLIGSTEGPPREFGPPRRSAREVVFAIEPALEIIELRSAEFRDHDAKAWFCLSRQRTIPAQPSTHHD